MAEISASDGVSAKIAGGNSFGDGPGSASAAPEPAGSTQSPTTAESLALQPTTADSLALQPTTAERLAAGPSTTELITRERAWQSSAAAPADPPVDPSVDPPAGAAAGLAFPPLANVLDGKHGTAATTAVQILETMSEGRPAFRPDVGLGGVQWFVTEGAPHVGGGAQNPVTIPVEIEAPRGTVKFGEPELTRIFDSELERARPLAEQQFRTRNELAPDAPLNHRNRNTVRRNAENIAERKMWTRVGETVAASDSGVGQVTLKNSRFSKSGDGVFMLTSRPESVRVRGGASTLVDILQRTGEPVDRPVLEAASKLAKSEKWAGRLQGAFHVGGRVLIVMGAVADGYRIYSADDRPRETAKVVGGWAGATAAGGAFATWASPSLATGPWGWLAYGVGTVGAGAVGYFAGESIAEEAYELIVDGDPLYVGPGD